MPAPVGAAGDGAVVVRQLDAVLLGVGFACSRELLDHLSRLDPDAAVDAAVAIVGAVRELVGDHVAHNTYFRDFPSGVPDTVAFWVDCVIDALTAGDQSAFRRGSLNLLGLRRYQHSYEEMAVCRDAFVASAKDRMPVLHLGRSLDEEARALYLALGASTVPLGEADSELLATLAAWCVDGAQPAEVPVRENLAPRPPIPDGRRPRRADGPPHRRRARRWPSRDLHRDRAPRRSARGLGSDHVGPVGGARASMSASVQLRP